MSKRLRLDGNEQYALAGKASLLVDASNLLKKAVNYYEEALKMATDNEERCLALRNLGMAYWRLGKNCDNRAHAAKQEKQADGSTYYYTSSHRTDFNPYAMMHFYKEAINAFCQCVPLANQLKPDAGGDGTAATKFIEKLSTNMNECAQEAISYLTNMDRFSTFKSRIEQIDHLIHACGSTFKDWSAVFHLEKAKTFHKWAVTEIERSGNYAKALHCLKECYTPLENLRSLLRCMLTSESDLSSCEAIGQFSLRHREELDDLTQSIQADSAVAEAMRLIQQGDAHLHSSIFDSENADMDGVHEAIDNYRAAIVTLHDSEGLEINLEAEAFSKMGQAHFNVLKNETQAKAHCMTAVQLAGTVEHQNFAEKEWFIKATAILKHMQDETRRKEEEEVRKNREPFLKALEKQLTELKLFEEKAAEILIAELPKKFPPKHKADSKVLEELANKKFTCDTPRSDVKKALSKLILLFHPDHVDIKTHGGEYFVLCEEITKVITKKYEYFKG